MRGTVLIVDDDRMVRRALARMLGGRGWKILETDGPDGVELLIEQVDVILTDWDMPNGGGERVIDEALVPVVVYSGNLAVEDRVETFVAKPANTDDLDMVLQAVMTKSA